MIMVIISDEDMLQYKVFVGLVWLTSSHMFGSGDFWDKSPLRSLNILKLPSFYWRNFRTFKNALGQYFLNDPRVFVRNDFTCNVTRRLSLAIYLTSLVSEVRSCLWKMAVIPELWS